MSVNISAGLDTSGHLGANAVQTAAALGYTHRAQAHWTYDQSLLYDEATWSMTTKYGTEVIVERQGALLWALCAQREVQVIAYATRAEDAAAMLAEYRERWPRVESDDEDVVPIEFWVYGRHGPQSLSRELAAPAWSAIAENYMPNTRAAIERMMSGFRPGSGGQLVLWGGDPGTGKTTALRALGREWRDWCELHYVTDPDKFFGGNADYMLQVMLEGSMKLSSPQQVGSEPDPEPEWRLLILEDAGELLRPDARKDVGQALSRFLNAVDGLIGQGLKVLVLVTTNEEIGKLHPAVARPGRCAFRIEFETFTVEEAEDWLRAHGVDPVVGGRKPLADLYAEVEGFERSEPAVAGVGFGA